MAIIMAGRTVTRPVTRHLTNWITVMALDKRKHERFVALNLLYLCEDHEGDVLFEGMGRTLNVSEEGLQLETHCFISPGNRLTLSVALRDELINLRGRVVYCRQGEGKRFITGLELQEVTQEDRVLLLRFIELVADSQSAR